MKTIAEQNFDEIIKECFHSALKPLDFKKKGNNFYRRLPDIGQIVNIQKSAFHSKDHISFTINTGLFIPEYWLTYYHFDSGEIPDFPTEPECAIRQRIGQMKYKVDKWFDLDQTTDTAKLKEEMSDNVINYIIPYFEKNKSKADVLELIQEQKVNLDKFARLIICGEYKQFDRAQIEYDKLKQDKYTANNLKSTLTEYREKYNLADKKNSS